VSESFDVVVIGTGTAASTVAGRCRKAGQSVAIIDELPYGGTCTLRGCDPKKLLRRGPEIMDAAIRMGGRGIVRDSMHIDWPALVAFKRRFTDPIPEKREKSFKDRGIETFHGTARLEPQSKGPAQRAHDPDHQSRSCHSPESRRILSGSHFR